MVAQESNRKVYSMSERVVDGDVDNDKEHDDDDGDDQIFDIDDEIA